MAPAGVTSTNKASYPPAMACGSRLVYRPFHADWIRVEMGSLDIPEDVPPKEHYGIESQVLWLTIDDGLPRKRTEDDPRFQELVTTAEKRRK